MEFINGWLNRRLRFGYGYGLNPKLKPVYHPYLLVGLRLRVTFDLQVDMQVDSARELNNQTILGHWELKRSWSAYKGQNHRS